MTLSSNLGSPWLVSFRRVPQVEFRVVLFPHAGAGPSAFRLYVEHFPPQAEIFCVQLPGRERRLREAPLSMPIEVLPRISDAVRSICADNIPTIMFGHSLGSLLAYGVAQQMEFARSAYQVRGLVLSGCRAPDAVRPERGLHWQLSDDDLISQIRQLNGTDQDVLSNPEMLELLLPTFRADIRLADELREVLFPSISIPFVAIGGSDDPEVSVSETAAWRKYTKGTFSQFTFPGDHFFIEQQRKAVCELICGLIS